MLLASDPNTRFNDGNVLNEAISTPGDVQLATINVAGELKKTVDLTPFNVDPNGAPVAFDPQYADDIIYGGLGTDFLHGGWGDDLLNADDNLGTNSGANDAPDTHTSYEDLAYGGAGRDRLIGNTGGDRLIDWAGEFNSYIVPFAPFGNFTISRTIQPQLPEFLYALSEGDGAD